MDAQPLPLTPGSTPGPQSKRSRLVAETRRLVNQNELDLAAKTIEPLTKGRKPDPESLFLLGVISERRLRFDEAARYAERSLAIHRHPEALVLLARCKRAAGKTDEAIDHCESALAMQPGYQQAMIIKGGALEEAGRFDEAEAVIGPMIEHARRIGQPAPLAVRFDWAKLLVHRQQYDEAVELLDGYIDDPATPDELRALSLYLRAKACDRRMDYEGAYTSAARANAIGRIEFDPELYAQQVTELIESWSAEQMARFPRSGCQSPLPVFVAGMPRSGTSLIDQIIDAHPSAAGVGELGSIERFALKLSRAHGSGTGSRARAGTMTGFQWTQHANRYVRELESLAPAGAERVVNKALGNHKLIGLIARLFPNTRVIHVIRDPRDVAISCLLGGFNSRVHPWTTTPEWISSAWAESMRLMEHWKQSLDIPILDVHYERLVTDPENEFPRIIGFLGLEWDEQCREFHRTRRTVRTLSYDQVNRPLYTTSVNRHRNYASQLKGVRFPRYDPFGTR